MPVVIKTEAARGCGYRRVGGLYLVCDGAGVHCAMLPVPLCRCPVCGEGISPSRGWTWVNPSKLIEPVLKERTCGSVKCQFGAPGRKLCDPWELTRAGLLWVGEKFYRTPADFSNEARTMGISKRLAQIPREFIVGETWVLLAHRWADPAQCECTKRGRDAKKDCERCKGKGWLPGPGVFMAYKPSRIERVVSEDQAADTEFIEKLEKRGITPVIVKHAEQSELEHATKG